MNLDRIEAAEVKFRDFSAYFWNTSRIYMINGMILILILLIFRSLMAMSLDVPLMVYIYI